MSGSQRRNPAETEESKSALLSNAAAISAVASAIEGTLGPKGLNCMLVDRFGEVTISNDGRAILERMEVSHPAARLLLQTAKAQDVEVGDGTTTACILASALIAEGVGRILDGVPVMMLVEGINAGAEAAMRALQASSRKIDGFDDVALFQTALIAGRGEQDIAQLVLEGAKIAGRDKLAARGFRLADWIVAKEGAENEVFCGIILDKAPLNRQMPRDIGPVKVVIIDDALEPEEIEEEALATEVGFRRYRELQEAFRQSLSQLVASKANLVLVSRSIAEEAEQVLGEAGVMAVRRVAAADLAKAAEHTGAKPIKRSWLRGEFNLTSVMGSARRAYYDEKLEHLRIEAGAGQRTAAMLVGANTAEVRAERQRIAEDAACAVQQAALGGIVVGGGVAEMQAIAAVERLRAETNGMAAYGVECVIAALKRPLSQIVTNAGFNPLEKVEEVKKAQAANQETAGVDCDTGKVCDLAALGVFDAANVKVQALKTAGEAAEAVLKINTIIRSREDAAGRAARKE